MGEHYILVTCLTAPLWFPPIRFVLSLFRQSNSEKNAYVWCYLATFAWSWVWVLYQWITKVPSGLGYFFALISAWLILFPTVIADPLFGLMEQPNEDENAG